MTTTPLIFPDWPAPARVKALATTRLGGVSLPPWDTFNLGTHVGDAVDAVIHNRAHLADLTGVRPQAIHWLDQVHGRDVLDLPHAGSTRRADAATTIVPETLCAILTADCLPVLFCDRAGQRVAAAHAGWRGLAEGVLENTLARFPHAGDVMAWLGPAIGPHAFEVGPEVRGAFLDIDPGSAVCFTASPHHRERFLADLYGLARRRLRNAGIAEVCGGELCTFSEPNRFFSYRRDGETGRQAALIWLTR